MEHLPGIYKEPGLIPQLHEKEQRINLLFKVTVCHLPASNPSKVISFISKDKTTNTSTFSLFAPREGLRLQQTGIPGPPRLNGQMLEMCSTVCPSQVLRQNFGIPWLLYQLSNIQCHQQNPQAIISKKKFPSIILVQTPPFPGSSPPLNPSANPTTKAMWVFVCL